MTPIDPTDIRYIKLGSGGRWALRGLEHGEVHFGYRTVPHDLCLKQDWDAVVRLLIVEGRSPGKAKDGMREIRDFYTLGSDCLWVAFADGYLWWAFGSAPTTRRVVLACARLSTAGTSRTSPASRCASTD